MDLLQDYGSENSSSDEEGPPPPASVTSIHDDDDNRSQPNKKRKNRKAIEIVSFQNVSPSTIFVRSVPHIPGNWAGHLFCPVPNDSSGWHTDIMTESVLRFQQHLENDFGEFGGTQIISHVPPNENNARTLPTIIPMHLSLSRPFALQLSSLESFVTKLQQRLQHLPATTLRVHPTAERILVNDDRTRSFWTWPVDANPTLMAILEEIDAVLQAYKQPTYYDPPLFHISLASVVGDLEAISTKNIQNSSPKPSTANKSLYMTVNQIHCTFGTTKHYKMDLLQR